MIKTVLKKLSQNQDLTCEETRAFIELVAQDDATSAQIGAFILGITAKEATVEELTGVVLGLREFAHKVNLPNAVCPCGTGADKSESFNISTTAAILASAADDIVIAKHANCAISSNCGSSNVIEELGIKLAKTPQEAEEQAQENGITFLHSPFFNTAVSKINPVRKELGMRTLFNFTGPLINPSFPKMQAFGASSVKMAQKMIEVLKNTGSERVLIFAGIDPQIDEISLSGETQIFRLENGIVDSFCLTPEDFGIKRAPLEALKGGNIKENADIIRNILGGKDFSAKRDITALNAAAIFWAANKVEKLEDGLSLSYNLIDDGSAYKKLEELQCLKMKIKR